MTEKPPPLEDSLERGNASILVIDDQPREAQDLSDLLTRTGYDCEIAPDGAGGLARLKARRFDVVLVAAGMRESTEILRQARGIWTDTEVVCLIGPETDSATVTCIHEGANPYLTKPLVPAELRALVAKCLERQAIVRDNRDLHRVLDEKFGFEGVVAASPAMKQVLETVKQIAPTTATVLIQGESGTGKELIARSVHNNSARKGKPFVALNCAALSGSILESELFGHEKGSFTGATGQRKGRFEYAHGGTLFLDEVGDLPMDTQVKLLRVIEEREVVRVGSNVPIPVDVRLLAATNRDLKSLLGEGRFREDLFFRLNVVSVRLPPLRERKEELPLLLERFVAEFARGFRKKVSGVSIAARKALFAHGWPGNVRELKNAIESMVAVTRDDVLDVDDLPDYLVTRSASLAPGMAPGLSMHEAQRRLVQGTLDLVRGNRQEAARILEVPEAAVGLHAGAAEAPSRKVHEILPGMTLAEAEKILIRETLESLGGNRKKAARMMGMGERTLYRKIKEYGLEGM